MKQAEKSSEKTLRQIDDMGAYAIIVFPLTIILLISIPILGVIAILADIVVWLIYPRTGFSNAGVTGNMTRLAVYIIIGAILLNRVLGIKLSRELRSEMGMLGGRRR